MSSKKLLEIKSVQCGPIKNLFEVLKEILADTNITFDKKGMKIFALDNSKVVLVHLRLHSEKFEVYNHNKDTPIVIGVNMVHIFKLLKNVTNNDTITFYINESNPNELGLNIENGNSITKFKYKLLDVDTQEFALPNIQFEYVTTIPSTQFQQICRQMSHVGTTVQITSVDNELKFECTGMSVSQETILTSNKEDIHCIKHHPDEHHIVQNKYQLKYLILFCKATNMCPHIELYLSNDFPLIIKYSVSSLGELKFGLSPKVEMD